MALPPQQTAEIEQVAPQLAVALARHWPHCD